jgi:hypothetical protein
VSLCVFDAPLHLAEMQMEIDLVTGHQEAPTCEHKAKKWLKTVRRWQHVLQLESSSTALQEWALASAETQRFTGAERVTGLATQYLKARNLDIFTTPGERILFKSASMYRCGWAMMLKCWTMIN